MLSNRKELIITIVLALLALAFVLSASDIHFEVSNSQLEADIDQYSEEKENLRAKYLSGISLNKLDQEASRLKMQQASSALSYSVSKKKSTKERKALKKPTNKQRSTLLVSGY